MEELRIEVRREERVGRGKAGGEREGERREYWRIMGVVVVVIMGKLCSGGLVKDMWGYWGLLGGSHGAYINRYTDVADVADVADVVFHHRSWNSQASSNNGPSNASQGSFHLGVCARVMLTFLTSLQLRRG